MRQANEIFVRWVRAGSFLLALTATCLALTPSEYTLKAAYLFNILRFTERSGGSPGEYFTLGIYSAAPIEEALAGLKGSPIHGRKLLVRPIRTESELEGCDAIFLGRMTGPAIRMLARAQGAGILNIGNAAGFAASGGMAGLVLEDRRVVVEVNPETLAAAGWRASSHLLEVARIVRSQTP